MSRNERQTCKDLIEPALTRAGWEWEEQVRIGPGACDIVFHRGGKSIDQSSWIGINSVA